MPFPGMVHGSLPPQNTVCMSLGFQLAYLKLFFSEGINLAVTGVLLDFDGHTSVRLWAVLGGMLQDGGAHKAVWHSRGDSASKFCIPCKNLFDQES